MRRKVLLDTSFLMRIVEGPIRAPRVAKELEAYDLFLTNGVINELKGISHRSHTKRGKAALFALRWGEKLKMLPNDEDKDDEGTDANLLLSASRVGAVLATLDRAIIEEARSRGIITLTLKRGILKLSSEL